MFEIPLMHRRLLPGEMSRWYLIDVGLPLTVTLCVVFLARLLIRDTVPLPAAVPGIGIACLAAFSATAFSLQYARRKMASQYA